MSRHHPSQTSRHRPAEDTTTNLKIALFLNAGFAIVELIGGLWTGSLAILSDALHDLGDSLSLAMAWFLQRLSVRRRDNRYSYGYRRFSLLGALINTGILVGGSALVISEAIPRLFSPVQPHAEGMVAFALLGIAVNGLATYRLSNDRSLSSRAVALHLAGDILGWVAVLLVSIVLLFTDLAILDPLLSVAISLWVILGALRGLRKAAVLFLQAIPEGVDLDAIEARLQSIEGVLSVHHTHLWSLDGVRHVFSTHLVVPEETDPASLVKIKCIAREAVDDPSIVHTTLELEFVGEACGVRDTP